jgi:AraC-like DNA-binding protein
MSFGQWRQQLQLIVAFGELTSKVPVQQVAEHLGYDSVTAFIAMFRKLLGTSPGRNMA